MRVAARHTHTHTHTHTRNQVASVRVAARDIFGNLVDVPRTTLPIAWLSCSVEPQGYLPVFAVGGELQVA